MVKLETAGQNPRCLLRFGVSAGLWYQSPHQEEIVFGIILLSVCTVMHLYVFWRSASVPFISHHLPLKVYVGIGVALWMLLFLGRVLGHSGTGTMSSILEFLGMTWLAVLFLTFLSLLLVDTLTLFGLILHRLSPSLRGAALIIAGILSIIAVFQGMKLP